MLLNRIGDFGFLLGSVLVFFFFRTVDFSVVFVLAPYFTEVKFILFSHEFNCLNTMCLFLFLGSVGKSAQIGLHTWLPDAMEGERN